MSTLTSVLSLFLAVILTLSYVVYRRRDPRLLRNGLFLVGAVWFLLTGGLSLLTRVEPWLGWVTLALWGLVPMLVLALAVFLLGNGVTMLRVEGHRLANLLSLLAGVALLGSPLLAWALVLTRNTIAIALAALLFFLCSYLGVVFVVFLVYSVVYGRTRWEREPSAVMVLGSKLFSGNIPLLLKSRLDRALTLYQHGVEAGSPPRLIPSGGQGVDESRSEGEAMAEYLIAHGAAPGDVQAEVQARNTEGNLVLSQRVQAAARRSGPTAVVTSDYHVLRAAVLARRLGLNAYVVGSPTARYYVPSAFLREFIAIVVEQKRLHLALILPTGILAVLLVLALNGSTG